MPRVNRNLYFRTGVLYSRLDLYGATRTFLTASYEIEFEKEFVIIPVAFLSQSVSVGIAVRLNGRSCPKPENLPVLENSDTRMTY